MKQVVIVLGMHRSGTSCLAGILENAGVYFGTVSTQDAYNLKGNRENGKIMNLHDSLLSYNSGSWESPPFAIEWPGHLKKERDGIINDFRDCGIWGFKDPRTLLSLEGWLEVLPYVALVGTFRHPFSVAQSLQVRNGFPIEKSLSLWKAYNHKLLFYADMYSFPLVSFDLPADVYLEKNLQLIEQLGLKRGIEPLSFFENMLRHNRQIGGELPSEIAGLYKRLNQKAL